jgi:hypothetical protein
MNSYIKEEVILHLFQINNMRIDNIHCPHCGLKLSAEIISEFIDNTTFNKYKLFLRNA